MEEKSPGNRSWPDGSKNSAQELQPAEFGGNTWQMQHQCAIFSCGLLVLALISNISVKYHTVFFTVEPSEGNSGNISGMHLKLDKLPH